IEFLKSHTDDQLKPAEIAGRKLSLRELVLYTYTVCNLPEDDPENKQLFDDMLKDKLSATYTTALQAMVLEEVDRVKYQKRIWMCAKNLVDNQSAEGGWSYGYTSIYVEDG